MKSTGEVMGIDKSFEIAFWKAEIALDKYYQNRQCILSAKDRDKVDWSNWKRMKWVLI